MKTSELESRRGREDVNQKVGEMKKGDIVYFWWSASHVYKVRFVEWRVVRTYKSYGVGAVVESDWLFNEITYPKIPFGCRRGQAVLAPHTDLHRSRNQAYSHKGKIRRPTIEQLRGVK